MKHLNGGIICAVDVETTGLKAGYHEICQIAIIALDFNLEPRQDIVPFTMYFKPLNPDIADPKALKTCNKSIADLLLTGTDPFVAQDMFDHWFNTLQARWIEPLAHNWPFDREFVADWLGKESFEHYFSGFYRCTMSICNYLNDRAAFHAERFPFPKRNLKYLCTTLGIPLDRAHDALADALAASRCYKKLMHTLVPN